MNETVYYPSSIWGIIVLNFSIEKSKKKKIIKKGV